MWQHLIEGAADGFGFILKAQVNDVGINRSPYPVASKPVARLVLLHKSEAISAISDRKSIPVTVSSSFIISLVRASSSS